MRRESAEQRRLREYRETVPPNLRKYAKPEHSQTRVSAIRLLDALGMSEETLQATADAREERVDELFEIVGSAFKELQQRREQEANQ